MVAPPSLKELQQLRQVHYKSEQDQKRLLVRNKEAARALLLAISTQSTVSSITETKHVVNS